MRETLWMSPCGSVPVRCLYPVGEGAVSLPESAEPLWRAICQRWLQTRLSAVERRGLPERSVYATEPS
jgi:hypothetical protein